MASGVSIDFLSTIQLLVPSFQESLVEYCVPSSGSGWRIWKRIEMILRNQRLPDGNRHLHVACKYPQYLLPVVYIVRQLAIHLGVGINLYFGMRCRKTRDVFGAS